MIVSAATSSHTNNGTDHGLSHTLTPSTAPLIHTQDKKKDTGILIHMHIMYVYIYVYISYPPLSPTSGRSGWLREEEVIEVLEVGTLQRGAHPGASRTRETPATTI